MTDKGVDDAETMAGLAFAELVMFIEEAGTNDGTAPVFKLADLAQLYMSRMEQLGFEHDGRVHTTRLNERLPAHFPAMHAQHQGRDVLLAFNDDLGDALVKACEMDRDVDAVHLARAAKIVRRHIIKGFSGFYARCQQDAVPPMLLGLVSMILGGPSIKDQSDSTTPVALTIAQLLSSTV